MNKKDKQRKRQRQKKRIMAEKQAKAKRNFWLALILVPIVAALGFFLAKGIFSFFSGDDQRFGENLSQVYAGRIEAGDEYLRDLAKRPEPIINEAQRKKIVDRLAPEIISSEYSPVHIFKENLWVGTGTLHEPSQVIATSEHIFPMDQPSGYFTYRYPWEDLPKTTEELKYLNFAYPFDEFENSDVAFAKPGRPNKITGFSDYDSSLLSQNFVMNAISPSYELTSLTDGSKAKVIAGMAIMSEIDPSGGVTSNRFVILTEHPVVLGESGTGFIGQHQGRNFLCIQSGYYERWQEHLRQAFMDTFSIPEDKINNVVVVYSFPMNLFNMISSV